MPQKKQTKTTAGNAVDAIKGAPAKARASVEALIENSRPALERAQAFVSETGANLSERTQALRKNLARGATTLGTRVEKGRKNLGKRVESAVKATLASLNIPTRSEINTLTRRVEELSKKIDALKKKKK